MDLCSEKHEQVCYDYWKCPVCDVTEDLQDTIDSLEKKLKDAQTILILNAQGGHRDIK